MISERLRKKLRSTMSKQRDGMTQKELNLLISITLGL